MLCAVTATTSKTINDVGENVSSQSITINYIDFSTLCQFSKSSSKVEPITTDTLKQIKNDWVPIFIGVEIINDIIELLYCPQCKSACTLKLKEKFSNTMLELLIVSKLSNCQFYQGGKNFTLRREGMWKCGVSFDINRRLVNSTRLCGNG